MKVTIIEQLDDGEIIEEAIPEKGLFLLEWFYLEDYYYPNSNPSRIETTWKGIQELLCWPFQQIILQHSRFVSLVNDKGEQLKLDVFGS